jgi:hypothetical protein
MASEASDEEKNEESGKSFGGKVDFYPKQAKIDMRYFN